MKTISPLKRHKGIDNKIVIPQNKLKKSGVLALLLAISVTLLTACGGGSGSSGESTSTSTPLQDDSGVLGVFTNSGTKAVVQMQSASAANNFPKAGSVTQSSSAEGGDVTLDSIDVSIDTEVTSDNGRQLVYTVTRTRRSGEALEIIFDGEKGTVLSIEHDPADPEDVSDTDFSTADLYKKSFHGRTWASIYTDYAHSDGVPVAEDSDYLTGGFWVYVPDDEETSYAYGVFVNGNDPFMQANLQALTGEATYQGEAAGIYTSEDESIFFEGEAELTATFGSNIAPGSIAGRIYDLESSEDVAVSGNPEVTLLSATISNDDSGFFTGDTILRDDEGDFTGKWGGQFYGNTADDNAAYPGSVAGTFGGSIGTSADNTKSFLGVFGAHKQ